MLNDSLYNIKPSYNIYIANLIDELDFNKKIPIDNKLLYGYILNTGQHLI